MIQVVLDDFKEELGKIEKGFYGSITVEAKFQNGKLTHWVATRARNNVTKKESAEKQKEEL